MNVADHLLTYIRFVGYWYQVEFFTAVLHPLGCLAWDASDKKRRRAAEAKY